MTMNEFPPEVLATIFDYLSEYEIKTASDVSPRWRDIASNWVLVPRAHLLLSNPPDGINRTPFHTIHIDGDTPHLQHHFPQHQHHFTGLHTVVLYGIWTQKKLALLSENLKFLPNLTTIEISGASPPVSILDFLLIQHNITKFRCFLKPNQSKSFTKLCERLRATHGLFEEVVITQQTPDGLKVYNPKPRSVKYPEMDRTTSLIIHPARLTNPDFDQICRFNLTSLTLNHPKHMPEHFLTTLSPSLKTLVLHNAKSVSHNTWTCFFKCAVMNSLEELFISGQNKIDSSIFDGLDKNTNLKKLYLEMHCPCADQCGVKSLLSWCPNIEVLVLLIPFSSDGVYDLVNINQEDVRKLKTLNIMFQVTPDMAVPKCPEDAERIADQMRAVVPAVSVNIQFRNHVREFLCDDEDDFE